MTVGKAFNRPLLAFLAGEAPDWAGRYLDDILPLSDALLEITHDYIQWLFPLPTPSTAVPGAPILTKSEIDAIRSNLVAQENLRRAAERMLDFYGATGGWLVWHDHNHLRITRIIRSLWLLLGPEEAEEFLDQIMHMVAKAGRTVSPKSMKFWRDAAGKSRS